MSRRTDRTRPRRRGSPRTVIVLGIALAAGLAAWGVKAELESGAISRLFHRPDPGRADEVPTIDFEPMEPRVAKTIGAARDRVLANLGEDEAWGRLGVLLDAHEIYDPAIACYRVARRLDPREFRWTYFLARVVRFQSDTSAEIVELSRQATRLRPDYSPAFVRLGDALSREGLKPEAKEAYARAVELDPQSWMAHRGLGQMLIDLGDPGGAVVALERAGTLQAQDGATQASLSRAYLLAGQREKAEEAANRARELKQIHTMTDPVLEEIGTAGISASICLRRANELIERGRFREALQNLAVVEEVFPDNPNVHLRKAACHKGLREPELAIASFQRALAIEDSIPGAHGQLGVLLASEGRFSEAQTHYRRALALDISDSAATRGLLAAALAQGGRPEEALREFERASSSGPLNAAAHVNWGALLAERSRPREAIPHFQEAARLDPKLASAYFNWGRALEDTGDLPAAIRQLQVAARLDPRGPANARLREITANSRN